ncbi:hypothetical protein [Bradyrhizobium sp. CCBAU 51753]|uniref:hypothetical protein n=1 Tax=Bradyrhizobium sp. CCBAU 51753 TaxID=1325100 RepID=UPI00188A5A2D|nr:hypothetical protein [Bradyrhizobium sp. CCBAU 51753]
MRRAHAKASATDHHARKIATAIAKGRPPAFSPDLDRYLEESPGEIFAALDAASHHMPPMGTDVSLAFGYLFLLQALLERLRYQTDRGYTDAAELIATFQAEVAARAEAGQIDEQMLAYVGGALHQASIPASPEFVAASAKQHADHQGELPADVGDALQGLLQACDGDPFALVGSLAEFGHAMPEQARGALGSGLAIGALAETRPAAVLFLLDSSPVVRRAVAGALSQVAASLSAVDLRRLVTMRNWRPEGERAELDTIIRSARTAGVTCAQWEAGAAQEILATAIDGAATQSFLLVSPAGRKKRVSSILTKGHVADAWSGEPETKRQIEVAIAAASMDLPMRTVSRSYLDRMLSHALSLTTDRGGAAPLGLLQVAETIGGADWQPARIDFRAALSELTADLPKMAHHPKAVAEVLRYRGGFAGLDVIEQSWFEDDPELLELVTPGQRRERAKLVSYLLQSFIARRRDQWAELLLRTALWMREAPAEAKLAWPELTIIARAIADGADLSEIGLMRDVAERTIAVLAGDGS